ncbi:MAG: hypothetical protein H7269_06695, partial [Cellulomonas sp.]|nr:hypothetical protein [Cellulomonas sp.]
RGRGGASVWTWGVTAGLVAAGAGVASLGLPGVAPSVAVVVAALAVAAALSVAASPLRAAGLRDAAAVALLTGVLIGLAVAGVSSAVRVGALAALGGSISVALLAGARRVPSARWARPAVELGAMAWVSAILLGFSQLPGAVILVPGLAAAAVWFVAVGVAWRQAWLQMMAPALACAAWFAFVADAVGGRASWYTLPIGIALLATVALWRCGAVTAGRAGWTWRARPSSCSRSRGSRSGSERRSSRRSPRPSRTVWWPRGSASPSWSGG